MPITRVSTQALRILDENRYVGFHSVFAKVVILRARERLITCTADAISSPHGLEMTSADLAQLQRLHHERPAAMLDWNPQQRRMSCRTATTVISPTPQTIVFDPALPRIEHAPMSPRVDELIGHLSNERALTGFGEQWLDLTADPHLRTAVNALVDSRADDGNVNDALLYLLGRGPGLTPSGDDVLVGMIAALWFASKIDYSNLAPLRHLIAEAGTRLTTDISVEYLHYACRGMAIGALRDLLRGLDRSDRSETEGAVDRLRRYGHTSGMDCLLGAVTGLRHTAPGQVSRSPLRKIRVSRTLAAW